MVPSFINPYDTYQEYIRKPQRGVLVEEPGEEAFFTPPVMASGEELVPSYLSEEDLRKLMKKGDKGEKTDLPFDPMLIDLMTDEEKADMQRPTHNILAEDEELLPKAMDITEAYKKLKPDKTNIDAVAEYIDEMVHKVDMTKLSEELRTEYVTTADRNTFSVLDPDPFYPPRMPNYTDMLPPYLNA